MSIVGRGLGRRAAVSALIVTAGLGLVDHEEVAPTYGGGWLNPPAQRARQVDEEKAHAPAPATRPASAASDHGSPQVLRDLQRVLRHSDRAAPNGVQRRSAAPNGGLRTEIPATSLTPAAPPVPRVSPDLPELAASPLLPEAAALPDLAPPGLLLIEQTTIVLAPPPRDISGDLLAVTAALLLADVQATVTVKPGPPQASEDELALVAAVLLGLRGT